MSKELHLIDLIETLIAEENYTYTLFKQFGRVPSEHREKIRRMRRSLKLICASRRLEIIAERNQQKQLPKQQELF